jgi:hypothetical protein
MDDGLLVFVWRRRFWLRLNYEFGGRLGSPITQNPSPNIPSSNTFSVPWHCLCQEFLNLYPTMTKTFCPLNWKRNFLILIFVFNLGMAIGQIPERDRLDTIAANVPNQYTKDVKKLTEYLVSHCSNDYEKARIIYSWIAQNIQYTGPSFFNKVYVVEYDSFRVLKKKKSQCLGLAMLYESMCSAAGLQANLIIGYANTRVIVNRHSPFFRTRGKRKIRQPNHAWNSVLVDGKWILVDVTWGLGNKVRRVREPKPKHFYTSSWFDVDPRMMAISHLPNDEKRQLLDTAVTMKEFMWYPIIGSDYIERGFLLDEIYPLLRKDPRTPIARLFWSEGLFEIQSAPVGAILKAKEDYSITIHSAYYNLIAVKTSEEDYVQVFSGDVVTVDFKAFRGPIQVILYKDEKDRYGEVILSYEGK